jgi:hypothetical protein
MEEKNFAADMQDRARVQLVQRRATISKRIAYGKITAANLVALTRFWLKRHRGRLLVLGVLAAAIASFYLEPLLQEILVHQLSPAQFAALHALLLTLGGSMVGATAISFSVVMLAVQLNFAKIPHALFRKLSEDSVLLALFFTTFVFAIAICALSVLPDTWTGAAIVLSIWIVVFTLWCFLAAYTRALNLVNPFVQLHMVLTDAVRILKIWERRGNWTLKVMTAEMGSDRGVDISRRVFFEANAGWDTPLKRSVKLFISFARAYATQAEYDVSNEAFNCLVQLNKAYVQKRGRTFADSNPFFDNSLSSEPLINDVLEQLRMLSSSATAARDEQLVAQIMSALLDIAGAYANINYGKNSSEMHHAQLAIGYLHGVIDDAARAFEADLMMEATRLVGRSGLLILAKGKPQGVISSV